MDGNRRYGRSKYGVPLKGHHDGSQKLVDFISWSIAAGVQVLTVYAFSTENWNRDQVEIDALMSIFQTFMHQIVPEALKLDIRVCVLASDAARLPHHVRKSMHDVEEATKHCTNFTLNICASYGSRDEIVRACQSIAEQVALGHLQPSEVTDKVFSKHLVTGHVSDPDVLIRTSGELRLSNFLLFQVAYAEMIFLEKNWPELTYKDFLGIIQEYNRRKRRFGK